MSRPIVLPVMGRARSDEPGFRTCQVLWCRFPRSHTTRGHVCGDCHQAGHGQAECQRLNGATNATRTSGEQLRHFYADSMPEVRRAPLLQLC